MNNIVILGGGSAGWITANLIQYAISKNTRPNTPSTVTLVESPQIGTIGVGEGSTPHLKRFFDQIGVPESEWMQACNATYKNGISFVNWTEHLNQNRYFHPFPSMPDRQTAGAFLMQCMRRHHGHNVETNPDYYFLANYLSQHGYGPKTLPQKPPIPMNYAYHFDANLLGDFLAKLGATLGVKHIQGEFVKAFNDQNDNIAYIELKDGQKIEGDFFIDASGFKSLLLQQHMQVDFESFANNLFNDCAIALPTNKANPLLAQTTATALKNGWAWHIPLVNRTGNGYVFSSQYTDFEHAEEELRVHIHAQNETKTNADFQGEARKIYMKVGQVKQAWKNNVAAIGLAQGFIEPLEATALHLVLDSINLLIPCIVNNPYNDKHIHNFNLAIYQRYQGIRDYIVCHYKVNSRNDSQYWRRCRNLQTQDMSDSLAAVLEAWRNKKDITPILEANNMLAYYPAISWYCLLSGYGYYAHAPLNNGQSATTPTHPPEFLRMRNFIANAAKQFVPHAQLLS